MRTVPERFPNGSRMVPEQKWIYVVLENELDREAALNPRCSTGGGLFALLSDVNHRASSRLIEPQCDLIAGRLIWRDAAGLERTLKARVSERVSGRESLERKF